MGSPAKKNTRVMDERRGRIARGRAIIQHGMAALAAVADGLDDEFAIAVDRIVSLRGCLVVCGIGKAGLIGRKLAATFSSTGTRAHFLHPSEALHGDLGCIGSTDLVLMLSNSGATAEVVDLLPFVTRRAAGLIAITSSANSPLARAADVSLVLPPMREACQHNLAPTTSTVAMLALGDALAMVVSETKGFDVSDFAELHPGGSLGRKLALVDDIMRPIVDCRLCPENLTIRQMFVAGSKPGRRTGAIMITDSAQRLKGIFTDSDLARMLEQRRDAELDSLVGASMTTCFSAIQSGARLSDAIQIMRQRKISELPVINESDEPVGMIDITDILGLEPGTVEARPGVNGEQSIARTAASEVNDEDNEEQWMESPTTLRIFGPLR